MEKISVYESLFFELFIFIVKDKNVRHKLCNINKNLFQALYVEVMLG